MSDDPRIAITVDEAAERVGLSRSSIEKLLRKGELAYKTFGNKRLISPEALQEWFDNLSESS